MTGQPPDKDQMPLWRAGLIPLLVFTGILGVLILGKLGIVSGLDDILNGSSDLRASMWAPFLLVGVFCVGAYLGAPQFALIAGAVLTFGPVMGSLYAWLATLCSGALTFWTGRWGGEPFFRRYAGKRATRVSAFLGRNSFVASMLVRLVPTAPFVVVNMAFGISQARFAAFLCGLAVGSLPKLAVIAFASQGLIAAEQGAVLQAVLAGIAVLGVWLGGIWIVQKSHRKRKFMPKSVDDT